MTGGKWRRLSVIFGDRIPVKVSSTLLRRGSVGRTFPPAWTAAGRDMHWSFWLVNSEGLHTRDRYPRATSSMSACLPLVEWIPKEAPVGDSQASAAAQIVKILKVQIRTLTPATADRCGCLGVDPETRRAPCDHLQSVLGTDER